MEYLFILESENIEPYYECNVATIENLHRVLKVDKPTESLSLETKDTK